MITIEGVIASITFYEYVQLLALILAIYFYIKSGKTFPAIIPFLFISNFFEIFIIYYFSKVYETNIIIYDIFNILNITYFFYVYYLYFKHKKEKNLLIGSYIIWISYTIYLFISNDFNKSALNHYTFGLFFIVFFIILYLKDVLNSNDFVDIKREPIFYFSVGILTFFVCTFPMLIFPEQLLMAEGVESNRILIILGNVVLNLGYLTTVIWSYKTK